MHGVRRDEVVAGRLSLAVVAALAITACGSDDDDDAGGTASDTADGADSSGGGGVGSGDDPSSGPLSAADQALADAIAADLDADAEDDGLGFSDVFDTQCMAEGTVAALGGAEAIEAEYGVTAEDVGAIEDTELSDEDARAVARAYGRCGDFVELFVLSFEAQGIATDDARCLLDGISDEQFEDFVAANFSAADEDAAGAELFDTIFASASDCGIQL